MFGSLRDFLWVLQAFLRGKVLRQKAYRPQEVGSFWYFRLPVPVTVHRLMMLTRWWGARSATAGEVLVLSILGALRDEHQESWLTGVDDAPRVPHLFFGGTIYNEGYLGLRVRDDV